jgi:hypothetical protein
MNIFYVSEVATLLISSRTNTTNILQRIANLSLLSFPLLVVESLHMSISTTVIIVQTRTQHHEQQEGQPEERSVAWEHEDEQAEWAAKKRQSFSIGDPHFHVILDCRLQGQVHDMSHHEAMCWPGVHQGT